MASSDHTDAEQVTAPLDQLATGLSVEAQTCAACDRPLRAGTPVSVALVSADTRWRVRAVRCQQCPPPRVAASQPTHLLAATLSQCSHVHTQTYALCLADPEPHTIETSTTQ